MKFERVYRSNVWGLYNLFDLDDDDSDKAINVDTTGIECEEC